MGKKGHKKRAQPSAAGAQSTAQSGARNVPQSGSDPIDAASDEQFPQLSGLPMTPIQSGPSTSQASGPSTSRPSESGAKPEPINVKDLAKEVKKLFIPTPTVKRPFPKRPDFLKGGSNRLIDTNHFRLTVGRPEKSGVISRSKAYHYDIEIERAQKVVIKDTNVVDKDIGDQPMAEKKKNQFTKKMATKLNRKIFQQMVKSYSQNANQLFAGINPVYDGQKNMFTSKILSGTENRGSLRLSVRLDESGRISEFFVNIKLAESNAEIDLNVLNLYHKGTTCDDEVVKKSILFINTLLRHNSSMTWIPIGQSIYNPEKEGQLLDKRKPFLLLTYGSYSSVRNLMIGPTLNVDRSAAAFYNWHQSIESIIGFILNASVSHVPQLTDSERRKVKRELSGLQVEATHISYGQSYRKYRIVGITRESAKDVKFEWKEKEQGQGEGREVNKGIISVAQYFQKKYRPLKFPQLPCLELGNANDPIKLPLEVCRLVSHQRIRRTMTNSERSEMTRISGSQEPHQRLAECRSFVWEQFHQGPMANINRPFLSEFEINVDSQLLRVNSVVIDPPQLKYGGQKSVRPTNGEWEMFRSKASFLRPAELSNWIVINLSFTPEFGDQNINKFVADLRSQAEEMGMRTTDPLTRAVIKQFKNKITFSGIKAQLKSFPNLQMILFITPDKANPYSDDIYSEIKLLGDVENGLTTQCANINSIFDRRSGCHKWNRSYLRQLMLKVNPKLGGTNVALLDNSSMPQIFKKESNLMIIGADVNHPAPADRISPSIAALVGSYDNEYSNYYTTVSMQPKSREEMIKNLDQMAIELLDYYKKKNSGKLPQRIIFYRDGVSEGQFQHVIDNEYPLLTEAFRKVSDKLNANYRPKLTFIVVQKRHHTRFMTADKKNVPPGTVVEKDITHRTDFDFYLCSHAGRLGTSRSAHYYVLADENRFNSDDMCKMTYYLCHIYQRCTKSVSIPAPVYYADLAAYRAKVHASAFPAESGSDSSSTNGDTGEEQQIRTYREMIRVMARQKEKLYFC